jgi:hypothetical protein
MDRYTRTICNRLLLRKCIGAKHTAIEHCFKGIPKHEIGTAKVRLGELINGGYLLVKPTSYGVQVSLNPEKMNEIKRWLTE